MEASYLRVKNWKDFQHYSDRRPPWIKLWQGLLGDDDDFARLDEFTQWQLVRIWLVASRSSAFTQDTEGREVPVVANDATSLQRSIQSLKKVPVAKLIREGWLIPVDEDELVPVEKVSKRPRRASKRASTMHDLPIEAEVPEVEELTSLPGRHSERDSLPETIKPENLLLVTRLMHRIGDHADDGTHHVIGRYAAQLPPASIAKVIESIELHHPADRAAYAVGALRREVDERTAA